MVVELHPFTPLADHVKALLAPDGKPLLGRARAGTCLPSGEPDPDQQNFFLPASERSSG